MEPQSSLYIQSCLEQKEQIRPEDEEKVPCEAKNDWSNPPGES